MKSSLLILLLATGASAPAQTPAFYGGDFDFRGFLESGKHTAIEDARVYDNVDNDVLYVDWVFGNFLIDGPLPTQLYYEFRQGVEPGSGGELMQSGTVAATTEQTFRGAFGMLEWQVFGLIPRIELAPERYWFTVAPVGEGSGHYYLSTTSGRNGTGSPLGDGNSFYDSETFGANFDPTGDWLGKGTWDFSLGFGNNEIPEPATFFATLAALALLALRNRRRA